MITATKGASYVVIQFQINFLESILSRILLFYKIYLVPE